MLPADLAAASVNPDQQCVSDILSLAVGIQRFYKARIYDRFRRAAFARVGVRQIESDPGEFILGNCRVAENIEASPVKAQ